MDGRRKKRSFFPWWGISGKDANSIFNVTFTYLIIFQCNVVHSLTCSTIVQNAGLLVLTDALLYSEPIPPSQFDHLFTMQFAATSSINLISHRNCLQLAYTLHCMAWPFSSPLFAQASNNTTHSSLFESLILIFYLIELFQIPSMTHHIHQRCYYSFILFVYKCTMCN